MQPICEGFFKGEGRPCVHSVDEKGDFCDLPEMFRCIEWIRRHEPILSYSTIKNSFCKRKLYLSYICGYELIVKPLPMKLGEVAGKYLDYLHSKDSPPTFDNSFLLPLRDDEGNFPVQIAAIMGLFNGYKKKEFDSMKGKTQSHFRWMEDGYPIIHGFMDLMIYDEKMGYEFKYTKKPETYSSKFIMQDQIGSYFLGNSKIERITVRAIQVPELKLAKNETIEDYTERVTKDFISRPLHYIHDTSFWRSEFNYDEIREKYKMIANEILRYIEMGGQKYFYQSNSPQTCFGEGTGVGISNCEYLTLCESGVVSDQIYRKREVK